jgi:transcriptional regulator with XRE-family HTH domain
MSKPTSKLTTLRKRRREEGLTQSDVAKTLGINQSTVSRRERNAVQQRHSDATAKLCNYAVRKNTKSGLTDRKAVKAAIDEVWRISRAHAVALSEIIETFVELSKSECGDTQEEPG